MKSFALTAGALAMAGCISPDWYQSERPPSARTLESQFRHPAYICQPFDDTVYEASVEQQLVPQRAHKLTHCSPVVVKGFLESIADRGVGITCLTISDVDATGAPANVDVRCKVSGPVSQEWAEAYRDVFQSNLSKSAKRERYEPASSVGAATRRAYFTREYPQLSGNAASFRGYAGIPEEFAREMTP